jgi:hypothetical protein
MHIFMRFCLLLGCIHELLCCTVSTYQTFDYYTQVRELGAPTGGYSRPLLYAYFMRDVVSGSLCMLILLYALHLTFILGWGMHQYIPYPVIVGGDLDRCEVMRTQRGVKKVCELRHEIKEIRKMRNEVKDIKENAGVFDNTAGNDENP